MSYSYDAYVREGDIDYDSDMNVDGVFDKEESFLRNTKFYLRAITHLNQTYLVILVQQF